MTTPTSIVAYIALFAGVGVVFLILPLLLGRLLRPWAPNVEKREVYECGEPTIGSSFVQFDLRFYVVALLFIIFDVEIAFFFPWATVFGKAVQLMDPQVQSTAAERMPGDRQDRVSGELAATGHDRLSPAAEDLYRELGVENPSSQALEPLAAGTREGKKAVDVAASARVLALMSLADIGVFFAVLLVGFAYVWNRGDLDWVRAMGRDRSLQSQRPPPFREEEPALT